MSMIPFARLGALTLAVSLAAGCSVEHGAPLAPGDSPTSSGSSSLMQDGAVYATPLTRGFALEENLETTYTVGPEGGRFEIPAAGLAVTIPAGAVSAPTTITARAIAGDLVAYDFGPHGTRFNVPLQVQQRLEGTNWSQLDEGVRLEAAYFADARQLDFARRRARINEVLPLTIQAGTSTVSFDVWHFSGYLVSSGRKRTDG
jgi:hypothetical protein